MRAKNLRAVSLEGSCVVRNEGMSHPDVGQDSEISIARFNSYPTKSEAVHMELHQMSAVGMTVNQHPAGGKIVGQRRDPWSHFFQ